MRYSIRRYISFLWIVTCIFLPFLTKAQCPANIGFESGTFTNWECSTGFIDGASGVITLGTPGDAQAERQTMLQTIDRNYDHYGNFPVSCPNGSNYSIRLGNNQTGKEAEQVSYTFTIPADQNNYSIIYNYAVVFQDPVGHQPWEKPKFTANVYDVTTNAYIGCSSFAYTASSGLPGFQASKVDSSVLYKTWTPVTIKLSGYAGRTIRLEFTTNDCTRGGHFGYAYIDVNQNCSSPISGNIQCLSDTAETLNAPFGFASYRWFTSDFSTVLSTDNALHFSPVPAPNSKFAVEVTPFAGQGCVDTVYTTIQQVLEQLNLAVHSSINGCITTGIDLTSGSITAGSTPGIDLTYYTNPLDLTYLLAPGFVDSSGTYYIKAENEAGCSAIKPVVIKIYKPPVFDVSVEPPVIRPTAVDITGSVSNTGDLTYTYWKDADATITLPNPYAVNMTGTYYIKATNPGGCSTIEPVKVVVGEPGVVPPNVFSPNGDGVHDKWTIPILTLYPDCIVEIFNRLGQLVFHSAVGYPEPWDGKFKGSDLPVATYYYVIKLRADLKPVGGSITIIK